MLANLISSGAVCLVALGVIALEAAALAWLRRGRPAGRLGPLLANALSGACLILALRAALLDRPAGEVALWLGLGLCAHLGDLVARLRA